METMYPKMLDYQNNERISLQSFLFGHRIKPQQTLYEYLIEFLIVAMSEKTIAGQQTNEMFPVSEQLIGSQIDYMPVSNMGLKRFIFFENSRIDTRADIDKQAYQKCCELIAEHISVEDSSFRKEDCMFILKKIYQLIVYAHRWRCRKCYAKTTTPNEWASCPKGGHHEWEPWD